MKSGELVQKTDPRFRKTCAPPTELLYPPDILLKELFRLNSASLSS